MPLRRLLTRFGALGRAERVVAGLFMLWAGLGLGHTGLAMARGQGWALQRSAASARTLGLPAEDWAPMVAGVRSTLDAAIDAERRLVVILPADTDSIVVAYVRFQLAHLEYPVRVAAVRDVAEAGIPPRVPPGALFVTVPEDGAAPFPVARAGDPLRP